jgi:hypothetical protein
VFWEVSGTISTGGKRTTWKNFFCHWPERPIGVASIRAQKGAAGSFRYTVPTRIKKNMRQVYQESPMFTRKQAE